MGLEGKKFSRRGCDFSEIRPQQPRCPLAGVFVSEWRIACVGGPRISHGQTGSATAESASLPCELKDVGDVGEPVDDANRNKEREYAREINAAARATPPPCEPEGGQGDHASGNIPVRFVGAHVNCGHRSLVKSCENGTDGFDVQLGTVTEVLHFGLRPVLLAISLGGGKVSPVIRTFARGSN